MLKPVLKYIGANYASPISLSELSRLAGMSPKYFCRFFKAALHRTPVDYLNYYRIEQACRILTATVLPMTETAYRYGFNDSSYFVKTFRKYMGTRRGTMRTEAEISDSGSKPKLMYGHRGCFP